MCSAGECVGTAVACDDDNACTADECVDGACAYTADDAADCDDDDACTVEDICDGSTCTGTQIECDDDDVCTTDSCDAELGCVYTSDVCDDEDICTTDSCETGEDGLASCSYEQNDAQCDDGNPCTLDECVTGTGCTYTSDTAGACDDGNACTTSTCQAQTKSASTCEELGWNPANYGNQHVCGESDAGNLDCDVSTHAEAEAVCSAVGARLCTANELADDEPRGTGCQFDAELVWSSTSCGDGFYWVRIGGSNYGDTTECRAETESAAVRCCADSEDAPDEFYTCQTDALTCESTGGTGCESFTCDPSTGCEYTIIESCDDGSDCTTDSCVDGTGCVYETDDSLCDDGVECTVDTCQEGSGCVFTPDDSACDGELGECEVNQCDSELGCVVAAADEGASCTTTTGCGLGSCTTASVSTANCDALMLDAASSGEADVCASYAGSAGACSGAATNVDATCAADSMRACTLAELMAGEELAGVGCGTDWVWTGDACDDGSTWAVSTDGTFRAQCILNDSGSVGAACCADADTSQADFSCVAEESACADEESCSVALCTTDGGCQLEAEFETQTCCGTGDCENDTCRSCVAAADSFCSGSWDMYCDDCAAGGPGYEDLCINVDCTEECACTTACDDGVDCTTDSCSGTSGCQHAPDETDELCGCSTDADCDDGIECTVDVCDAEVGCITFPDDAFCDDGDLCTGTETCSVLNGCQEGTADPACDF